MFGKLGLRPALLQFLGLFSRVSRAILLPFRRPVSQRGLPAATTANQTRLGRSLGLPAVRTASAAA